MLYDALVHPLTSFGIGLVGGLASVIGAVLTVRYSTRAAAAADAAKTASDDTRNQIKKINVHSDLNEVLRLLDDIRRRIDSDSWEMVSERATQIRLLLVPISRTVLTILGEEDGRSFALLVAQMKQLSETGEKQRDPKARNISKPRLQKLVADFKETVVFALSTVKEGINGERS